MKVRHVIITHSWSSVSLEMCMWLKALALDKLKLHWAKNWTDDPLSAQNFQWCLKHVLPSTKPHEPNLQTRHRPKQSLDVLFTRFYFKLGLSPLCSTSEHRNQ